MGNVGWGLSKAKVTSSRVALVCTRSPLAAVVDGSPTPTCVGPLHWPRQLSGKQGLHHLFTFPKARLVTLTNAQLSATSAGITPTHLGIFNCTSILVLPSTD